MTAADVMWTEGGMNINGSSFATASETFEKASWASESEVPRCLMLNLSAFRFHDESRDVVSTRFTSIFNNVIHIIVFPILFFVGFPSNIVNLVVFYRHGLRQRINLCLFCLSLMDWVLVTVGFLIYVENFVYKDFATSYRLYGRVTALVNKHKLTALFTGSLFSSQFVSAVIAGERCLCVSWPLRSSAFVNTKTIGAVLLTGILLIFAGRIFTDLKYEFVCVVDVVTGAESYFMTSSNFFANHRTSINILDGLVFGLVLPVLFSVFVIFTTVITAINLRKSTKFRKESFTSSSASSSSTLSERNVAVTKMLIYLSLQYIVLSMSNILFRMSLIFLPELSMNRNWANLYFLMLGVTGLCGMLSGSLNFLVYAVFGSKYRHTVQAMLCWLRYSEL